MLATRRAASLRGSRSKMVVLLAVSTSSRRNCPCGSVQRCLHELSSRRSYMCARSSGRGQGDEKEKARRTYCSTDALRSCCCAATRSPKKFAVKVLPINSDHKKLGAIGPSFAAQRYSVDEMTLAPNMLCTPLTQAKLLPGNGCLRSCSTWIRALHAGPSSAEQIERPGQFDQTATSKLQFQ